MRLNECVFCGRRRPGGIVDVSAWPEFIAAINDQGAQARLSEGPQNLCPWCSLRVIGEVLSAEIEKHMMATDDKGTYQTSEEE